jgi:cell division septum initiation protein DivIVA
MYIVYEEHIEQLEEENEDLRQEVLVLKRKLEYYEMAVNKEIEGICI